MHLRARGRARLPTHHDRAACTMARMLASGAVAGMAQPALRMKRAGVAEQGDELTRFGFAERRRAERDDGAGPWLPAEDGDKVVGQVDVGLVQLKDIGAGGDQLSEDRFWYCRRYPAPRTPCKRPSRPDGMRLADGRRRDAHLHWICDPLDRHGGFPRPERLDRWDGRFGRPMGWPLLNAGDHSPSRSSPARRSRSAPENRPRAAHAGRPPWFRLGRGADAGRKRGGYRVCGRHTEVWDLDIGAPIAIFHCDARARCYAAVDKRRRRRPRVPALAEKRRAGDRRLKQEAETTGTGAAG